MAGFTPYFDRYIGNVIKCRNKKLPVPYEWRNIFNIGFLRNTTDLAYSHVKVKCG